jgi:hypothetical protein
MIGVSDERVPSVVLGRLLSENRLLFSEALRSLAVFWGHGVREVLHPAHLPDLEDHALAARRVSHPLDCFLLRVRIDSAIDAG